jgi:hypothetical protein
MLGPVRDDGRNWVDTQSRGAGGLCEPVELGRDDEVVARQTPNGMGPERDHHLPPGHGQLGVMELPFGEQRDLGGEAESIPKVAEGELPAEPTDAVSLPALIQMSVQRSGLVLPQRRGAFRVLDGMLLMQRPSLAPWSWAQLPAPRSRSAKSGHFWVDDHNDMVTSGH